MHTHRPRLALGLALGLSLGLALPACEGRGGGGGKSDDIDGDGLSGEDDCDDHDATVGGPVTAYVDEDGDGVGVDGTGVASCDTATDGPAEGQALLSGDCNDAHSGVYPGNTEVCDGVDQDCDDTVRCAFTGIYWAEDAQVRVEGVVAYDNVGETIVDLGDLDGDGKSELATNGATAASGQGRVWLLRGADLNGLTTVDSIAAASWTGAMEGANPSALVAPGDLSGDGVADLAFGGGYAHAVWIVPTDLTGEHGIEDARTEITWSGFTESYFGATLAAVGDLSGDSLPDLAVSAMGASGAGDFAGAVYLFNGPVPAGSLTEADADAAFVGEERDGVGQAVSGEGDLNGDGLADLVVGSQYGEGGRGVVWVVYGPIRGTVAHRDADLTLIGTGSDNTTGSAVTLIGDSTGDGLDDLLIGAPSDAQGTGAVYLIPGPAVSGSIPILARTKFEGQAASYLGMSTDDVGDLNVDGLTDLALPAPVLNNDNGAVYVFYSPVDTGHVNAIQCDARFDITDDALLGTGVASADVTGDGHQDLLLGASSWNGPAHGYEGALFAFPNQGE